jgi:glutaryl-CoA dehydrogenase
MKERQLPLKYHKRNNVDMAIHIAREARQILGAMGISGEYSIMRHDESRTVITMKERTISTY